MNIYQLQYTRLGRQGSGAGWQVAAVTRGTPQIAVNAFYKLASNLVAAGTGSAMPPKVWDIQLQDHFAFISRVNYNSRNIGNETDIRGVSFVHAYAVRAEDFQKLMEEPDRILGWRPEAFEDNYDGKKELPQTEEIPFDRMERKQLMERFALTEEDYARLMSCVYAAIGSASGSLCICLPGAKAEEFEELAREAAFLVYDGLPYLLRLKLSVFSYRRSGAAVYFAESAGDGESFFNLGTKTCRCQEPPACDFIRDSLQMEPGRRRELFDAMDDFTGETYGGNYEAVRIHHLELAYHAVMREARADQLDSFMKEASGIRAYHYDRLDSYFDYLLSRYLEENREIPADSFRRLLRRYGETENQELKRNLLIYYAEHLCVPGNEEAYETVYRFQTEEPEAYQLIWSRLESRRPEFLSSYYLDYYLNAHIDSLEKCGEFLQENPSLEPAVAERIIQIVSGLFQREMGRAAGNSERYALCRRCGELCASVEQIVPEWGEKFRADRIQEYWKRFDERQFSYRMDQEYEEMGLYRPETQVPDTVRQLMRAREELFERPNLRHYAEVFLGGRLIREKNRREALIDELRSELKRRNDVKLDTCLLLNYRGEAGFSLGRAAQDMRECGLSVFLREPEMSGSFADSAVLSAGSTALEQFKSQLQEMEKGRGDSDFFNWVHVYQYYFPKKENGGGILDYIQKWLLFLAMIPVNVIVCRYLIQRSAGVGYGVSAAAAVFLIGGMVFQLGFDEMGLGELFEEYGAGAVIMTVCFAVIGIALAAFAVLAPVPLGMIAAAIISALLFAGQLVLLWKIVRA